MSQTADTDESGAPEPPVEERQATGQRRIEGRSPWRLAWERLRRDRVAMASAAVILLIGLVAIFAGVIADVLGHPPDAQYRTPGSCGAGCTGLTAAGLPIGPNSTFLFGSDYLGRDILVRVAYGARISLLIGVVASGLAVAVGILIGLVAGYTGGATDTVLSRFMDVVLSFPFLLAGIAVVSVFGPGLTVVVLVIAFFTFAAVGRIVRGQTLSIREKEYVEAARSLGASDGRIMFKDVLPKVVAPVLVYATLLIPLSIVFAASLSFLGLGVPPPTAAWGRMISNSTQYYREAPWFVFFPGGALLLTTLAFNLLGDSVRDALDPRGDRSTS